jgi:hypothetical protein
MTVRGIVVGAGLLASGVFVVPACDDGIEPAERAWLCYTDGPRSCDCRVVEEGSFDLEGDQVQVASCDPGRIQADMALCFGEDDASCGCTAIDCAVVGGECACGIGVADLYPEGTPADVCMGSQCCSWLPLGIGHCVCGSGPCGEGEEAIAACDKAAVVTLIEEEYLDPIVQQCPGKTGDPP